MTTDFDAYVLTCTDAAIRLLLKNKPMQAGLAVTGGDPLDRESCTQLAHNAIEAEADILHLEFEVRANGFGLTGATVIMLREQVCRVLTGCRLWLNEAGDRALILPQGHLPGHLRLLPYEVAHVQGKPAGDLSDGIRRAEIWLEHQSQSKARKPSSERLFDLSMVA